MQDIFSDMATRQVSERKLVSAWAGKLLPRTTWGPQLCQLARNKCWEKAVPGCPLVIQGTARSEVLELQQEVKPSGEFAETINAVQ